MPTTFLTPLSYFIEQKEMANNKKTTTATTTPVVINNPEELRAFLEEQGIKAELSESLFSKSSGPTKRDRINSVKNLADTFLESEDKMALLNLCYHLLRALARKLDFPGEVYNIGANKNEIESLGLEEEVFAVEDYGNLFRYLFNNAMFKHTRKPAKTQKTVDTDTSTDSPF